MLLDKINFFRLEKQNLLKKIPMKHYLQLIESNIGLHSTDYLTPYISLWSRVEDFNPTKLFDDLNTKNKLLRMRAMRGTLFLIHENDIATVLMANDKIKTRRKKEARKYAPNGFNYDHVKELIIAVLQEEPHQQFSSIKKKLKSKIDPKMVNFAKSTMELEGIIIRSKQRNILDKLYAYSLLTELYPTISLDDLDYESAVKLLFKKYLSAFGPISLDDFCWWLPATKTLARKILNDLDEIQSIEFNGMKYYMTNSDYDQFVDYSFTSNDDMIFFLPYEDHFPKAYLNREFFISEEMIPNLFGVNNKMAKGEIRPSIWVNGKIVGRWEYSWVDKKKTQFKVEIEYLDEQSKMTAETKSQISKISIELEEYLNHRIYPLIK